ncbi:MAG: hypothetical protein JKX69_13125 [Rhodobacteraceae bacterium]|nr:hypothetical protein [Paracoccaceae bacterium]
MLGADNRYSTFVIWSKIMLPLAALALLSTLFLFARKDEGSTIPVAEIQQIARESRISAAAYTGVAKDGSPISLQAETILPDADGPDTFAISQMRVQIGTPDGTEITVTSGEGTFDGRAQTAQLAGLARLTVSTGYLMETTGFTVDLATGRVESLGPLEVRAPYGALTAGHLTIYEAEDGRGQQMVFNERVHLIYYPQIAE